MSGWMGCLCKILQPWTDAQPLTPMDKLKETHKKLKKKSQTYKKKASQEARKEKEFRRAGDERAASRCSEMKTLYYKQIEQLENSQLRIRKTIIFLEGEKARTETVDALESGEEELKRMQEVKNTDDGDRTVDEMNRGMENVNESEDSSSIFSDAATHFDGVTILTLCLILVMLLIIDWVDLKLPPGQSMLISNHLVIPGLA